MFCLAVEHLKSLSSEAGGHKLGICYYLIHPLQWSKFLPELSSSTLLDRRLCEIEYALDASESLIAGPGLV